MLLRWTLKVKLHQTSSQLIDTLTQVQRSENPIVLGWMMKINLRKTKIMVFHKSTRKNAEPRFLIDGQIINVVQEYNYLGTQISSSGNISVSLEHLKGKVLHA